MSMFDGYLDKLAGIGVTPYLSSTSYLLPSFDLQHIPQHSQTAQQYLLENSDHRGFHQAYVAANAIAFETPDITMPNWVYIDCVLMQSAVIGFAIETNKVSLTLKEQFAKADIDITGLPYVPISGQIAGMGMDGQSLIGFSLFSLLRYLPALKHAFTANALPSLSILTKFLALKTYRAEEKQQFLGIAQYDNRALKTHGKFAKQTFIHQATIPLHPRQEMSFIYRQKVDLDESRIFTDDPTTQQPSNLDFMLSAHDKAKKLEMQQQMLSGQEFEILSPFQLTLDDTLMLPIKSK